MPKITQYVDESTLASTLLPNHDKTYTVIPYSTVIKNSKELIQQSNFEIVDSVYKSNNNQNIAQGIYKLRYKTEDPSFKEDDLSMMFAWTNSYDKSTRFQCAVGAVVNVCNNGMISSEMVYSRKHTGSADLETLSTITSQIKKADQTFKNIISDKENIKHVTVNKKLQAELIGRLFYEEEILSANQLSIVKNELKEASYNYNVDKDSLWAFYNHVTHALKTTHPKAWMINSKRFHEFITTEFISVSKPTNSDMPDQGLGVDLDDIVIPEEINSRITL